MSEPRCVVFTGPTLAAPDAETLLACVALPPARQGDVWRALRTHGPTAIGLIDGVFLHEPSVWHREILWALSRGVHVFGAASMGALRAAELALFGMRGVGKVFAAYRDGMWPGFAEPFEDDDEVAVIHAPAEIGAAALSDAMVDLRDTLLAAETAGAIDRDVRDLLAHALKRLPFAERGFAALAAHASAIGADALLAWLPRGRVGRKRLDAVAMLAEMAAFLATDPAPFQPAFRFERAQVWEDFVAGAEREASAEEALTLDELRLLPAEWPTAERAGLGRLQAVASAPAPPANAERAAFDRIRRALGLARRSDVDAWLDANAAHGAVLARLLHDEAALAGGLAVPPAGTLAATADHLRLSGQFAPLLARARAKQIATDGRPVPASGPELDTALAWFAELHGGWSVAPADASRWPDDRAFRAAVWREYVFAAKRRP